MRKNLAREAARSFVFRIRKQKKLTQEEQRGDGEGLATHERLLREVGSRLPSPGGSVTPGAHVQAALLTRKPGQGALGCQREPP